MANRPAPALPLRDGDREVLARITRSTSVRAGLAQLNGPGSCSPRDSFGSIKDLNAKIRAFVNGWSDR